MIELGGNISLVGFKEFDGGVLVVVKKIVGSYGKKFADSCKNFQALKISVKKVHERETSEIYELQAQLDDNGKMSNAEVEDRNLFVALDSVLKKIEAIHA